MALLLTNPKGLMLVHRRSLTIPFASFFSVGCPWPVWVSTFPPPNSQHTVYNVVLTGSTFLSSFLSFPLATSSHHSSLNFCEITVLESTLLVTSCGTLSLSGLLHWTISSSMHIVTQWQDFISYSWAWFRGIYPLPSIIHPSADGHWGCFYFLVTMNLL